MNPFWRDTGRALSEACNLSRAEDERRINIWWNIGGVPNRYFRRRGIRP